MRTLSRDSFARQSLCRAVFRRIFDYSPSNGCVWCGSQPSKHHPLYCYGVDADDRPHVRWYQKAFCSVGCYRAYTS